MAKSRITFTDVVGAATLESDYPVPACRFAGWTPITAPRGEVTHTEETGARIMNRLGWRYGASFRIEGLAMGAAAGSALDIVDRFIGHVLGGGTCAVMTEDANASTYATCGLMPGTTPTLRLADRRALEYALDVALVNLASSPVPMLAYYGLPAFTQPDSISGLALWLKADAIEGVSDGANLTEWVSSEGSAYSFTKPAYVSGYPTFETNVVNGKPVVRHIGSGSVHKRLNHVSSAFYITQPTLFVVMAWKTATTGIYRRGPGCRPSAAAGYGINRSVGSLEYDTALVGISGGTGIGAHGAAAEPAREANGVFHVCELVRIVGTGLRLLVNGVQTGADGPDTNLSLPTGDDPFFTCGYYDTGTSITDGLTREDVDVAEIVLFNRGLSASERASVRTYLGAKYGIGVL